MERVAEIVLGILYETWVILNDSAPYILIGFLMAALIKALIPDRLVAEQLGKRNGGAAVIKAALFGIPIPLCSCGVVPAAMGLRKQGASRGATTSFLVSTPETGIDSIAITWALMDPIMTVFRPIAAFVSAMVAGFLENRFGADEAATENDPMVTSASESCCCDGGCAAEPAIASARISFFDRLRGSLRFAFGDLLADIGKWLAVGIILAGIVAYAVPESFFERYLGPGIAPMLIMLVAGIPIYVCATCATPFAAALVLKGLSPGAALVFLISGPATNAATMTVVYKLMGRKSLIIYLTSIAVCALGMGYLLDFVYSGLGIRMVPAIGRGESEGLGWFSIASSVVLVVLIARSLWEERKEGRANGPAGSAAGIP